MPRSSRSPVLALATLGALLGTTLGTTLGCQKGTPSGEPTAMTAEMQTSNVQVQPVTWPSAATIDRLVLGALPDAERAKVAASPVPVLVPNDPQLLAAGKVVVDAHWYSFSARVDGLTVTVAGNRAAHVIEEMPKPQPNRSIRTTQGFVTTNEGVREASWLENGVAYVVDVECYARDDARCAGDDFVLQAAEGLKFVGPAAPQGSP